MAAFIRFVFTILVVGMVVNLAIVLLANTQSQRRGAQQNRQNAEGFAALIGEIDGRARRADIVVEAHRVDAKETVLESTLLLRQYRATGNGQSQPLTVVRIVIPGDKLQAGGVVLNFDKEYAGEGPSAGEYPMLREAQLAFFGLFCGIDETAPAAPNTVDERFTFIPRDQVPELVRLNPRAPQASYFELRLWQSIWSQMPEIPKDARLPWVSQKTSHFKATWMKPATITVRIKHTYSAFVSVDGTITLTEDEPGLTDLIGVMLKEGQKLNLPAEE